MLFWLLFASMTGAAVLAVLWPLGRARKFVAAGEADLAVYRDQLAEIERDRARGLLAAPEAEAARIEISRRLIAAGDAAEREAPAAGSLGRRRLAAVLALVGVPLLAIGIYGAVGSPGLPDAPLKARLEKSPEQMDAAILVRQIEAHLAQNPKDGRGWELLGPIYLGMGRVADAVQARANALQLLGATPAREADLGEALVAQADGIVSADAHAAFERARTQDSTNAKALFFLGLAAEQDGRAADAVAIWHEIEARAALGDPWRIAAMRRIARVEAANAGQGKR
ncbi:MAG: c-type cytochrome biogenesis protein CcmI [Xanthobacteraceae bacterium]